MKRKFLKKMIVACATILACSVLTACDGKGSDSKSGSDASATEDSASSGEGTEATTNTDRFYLKDVDLSKYLTVKDYQNFRVARDAIQVSDAEVEELLDSVYINSFPEELGVTDREVIIGDTVIIDYEGKKDGVAFDGGTAEKSPLTIGSSTFIDGFEEGLVGVKPGETVDLNLRFPDGYHNADLAGQDVVFTVKVHYIIPEEKIDEAIAGLIEEVNTVEDLRQYVYDYLYSMAEMEADEEYEEKVMDAFVEEICEFKELPQEMISFFRTSVYNNVVTSALQMGTDPETLIQYYYMMDLESFLDSYSEIATQRELAMLYVAKQEDLLIMDDANLDTVLEDFAVGSGYASGEEFLTSNGMTKEDFRQDYAYNNAFDLILDLAQK